MEDFMEDEMRYTKHFKKRCEERARFLLFNRKAGGVDVEKATLEDVLNKSKEIEIPYGKMSINKLLSHGDSKYLLYEAKNIVLVVDKEILITVYKYDDSWVK